MSFKMSIKVMYDVLHKNPWHLIPEKKKIATIYYLVQNRLPLSLWRWTSSTIIGMQLVK